MRPDHRENREVIKGLIILVIFFVFMAWWSAPQAGSFSASYRGNSIRITDKPCVDKGVVSAINKHIIEGRRIPPPQIWGEASGTFNKKEYKLCWVATNTGKIIGIFEDGDYTLWEMRDFKKDSET